MKPKLTDSQKLDRAFDPLLLETVADQIAQHDQNLADTLRLLAANQRDALKLMPGDGMEPEAAVRSLLHFIGEDPAREGLRDTPARVAKALKELTIGYSQDPAEILKTTFRGEGYDEIVAVPQIEFVSMCEHHMLQFSGVAHVAYIPVRRVVGLSKIPRLVDCFARRLQIQEKMTRQIADAMLKHLRPKGVAVVVHAKHSCMSCRGVMKQKASMVTSAMLGAFRDTPSAKAEFFKLLDLAKGGV